VPTVNPALCVIEASLPAAALYRRRKSRRLHDLMLTLTPEQRVAAAGLLQKSSSGDGRKIARALTRPFENEATEVAAASSPADLGSEAAPSDNDETTA
jgi:hypothetical protein